MQVAAFARLTGNQELLGFSRERFKTVLIPNQMAADGSFPQEMRRTKPYGYALQPRCDGDDLSDSLDSARESLDVFELADGRGMRKAMEFMRPTSGTKRVAAQTGRYV